jgi:hypothetical protein
MSELAENLQQPTVELQIVQVRQYAKPDLRGHPLAFDSRCFIRICHHIEQGESASDACRMEGVFYRSFRRHVTRFPNYAKRLKHAEEIREQFLREYHIANIKKHAEKTVVASMFWLERRYPNEFALRTVNRQINSEELVLDRVTPEQLIEDIKLAREVAGERPQLIDGESKD